MSADTHAGTHAATDTGTAGRLDQAVLLTGATGRVGARFLPLLRQLGARLRVAVWNPAASASSAGMLMGDLTDPEVCREAVRGMDAVVHMASAFMGVDAAGAAELNHRATRELAAAAADAGVTRFVQMSSSLVYRPVDDRALTEDDAVRPAPAAPFAAAKLGSEQAVRELADRVGVYVLRVAYTYGEGDPHIAEAFDWARTAERERRIHLVHHADVRQSVLHALRASTPGTFNIADDRPVTAAELDALAADVPMTSTGEIPDLGEADLPGAVDTTRARETLGYRPGFGSIHDARRAEAI